MSDARRYAVWPEPRSRSRSLKGSRPSVPHGTNFYSTINIAFDVVTYIVAIGFVCCYTFKVTALTLRWRRQADLSMWFLQANANQLLKSVVPALNDSLLQHNSELTSYVGRLSAERQDLHVSINELQQKLSTLQRAAATRPQQVILVSILLFFSREVCAVELFCSCLSRPDILAEFGCRLWSAVWVQHMVNK